MKKLAALVSIFSLSVAITACGTAGTRDMGGYGYDRHIYNVNYHDVDDVYDGGRNRTIYTDRVGHVPMSRGYDAFNNRGYGTDQGNALITGDEDVNVRTRMLQR
ncbi:hypothetical protein [Ammoniphilus sp. CFH 90114]|uniref:hypothetical protein n=1 Tax=Ammoniphilus sp. CFH 90114 TaxID=2493665 RepID=UPI00100FF6E9|nr:hypothetical protein [Ammoniphilus sp. CFH 90114]RXT04876.1 hypothetical protein EIZ39_19325 [Ammoniphilus sp. CFH 90114]